jgi:hypothetical protein
VNRFLAVELDSATGNVIRAQSAQEAWAVGKVETIARLLQRYRVRSATWVKRSLSPEIANVWARMGLVVSLVVLFGIASQLLNRLIPDAVVFPSSERQSILLRAWPGVVAAFVTIATSVLSALIFAWLSGMLFRSDVPPAG